MTLPLVITPGDPRGIGPEVTVAALLSSGIDAVIVGDRAAVARWGGVDVIEPAGSDEAVEVASLRHAVAMVRAGEARGLVTGPIHKGRLAAAGWAFRGHTDFLGHLCGARPVMAFVGGSLKVALVTTHIPLRAVPEAVTTHEVLHTLRVAHEALVGQLGLSRPRLLVCGLNPHAGDDGALGTEDRDHIAPAVEAARAQGIDAVGPISAEAAFRAASDNDMVVAMYHDQGLAPLKLVDFGRSVNWTLGLPFVRTSVDHGTADDIAGAGVADASSMVAAIALADRLTRDP